MSQMTVLSTIDAGAVMLQTATWEGFTVESVKSKKAPEGADFLPAKVIKDGHVTWAFKRDHAAFNGLGMLLQLNDEYVIALATKQTLHVVIPIADTVSHVGQMPDGSFIGGRRIEQLITLKGEVARLLDLEPLWSQREEKMRAALVARRKQQEEQKAQEVAARREAARALREAQRNALCARRRVYAYTATGDRRHGIPVVGDEWNVLPNDMFCIQVESYDGESHRHGAVLECFTTKKTHAGVVRDKVTPVTEHTKSTERTQQLQFTTKIVELKGVPQEVIIVPSMDDVHTLKERGLNNGTLVLIDSGDVCPVVSIEHGCIKTVTHLRRVSHNT